MTAFPHRISRLPFIIDGILAWLLITRGGKMVLKAKENDIGKHYIIWAWNREENACPGSVVIHKSRKQQALMYKQFQNAKLGFFHL